MSNSATVRRKEFLNYVKMCAKAERNHRVNDKGTRIQYVCSDCGSSCVGTVALTTWCEDKQDWEATEFFTRDDEKDPKAHCGGCGADNSKGSSIRLLPVEI